MKIKSYETFKCDAGWRTFSFLKLVTDSGIVVVPAGYFPPRSAARNPFLSLAEPTEPGADGTPRIEMLT